MTKLLPCPFCGGPAEEEVESNGYRTHWVVCNNRGCGCEGPYQETEDDARKAWNRRHSSTPSNAKREERAAS